MDGGIKLHRKLVEWEWYTDANVMRIFLHILLKANWKDRKWQGIDVKRGSLISSYDAIAEELKISKQSVRTAIKKLISTGELTHKTTNRYSIFTVSKYSEYQNANTQATLKQHPKNEGLAEEELECQRKSTHQLTRQKTLSIPENTAVCNDKKNDINTPINTQTTLKQHSTNTQLTPTNKDNKDNIKDIKEKIYKKEKAGDAPHRFIPPTVEQVRSMVLNKGYDVDPEQFVDFYESKGWMVGKNKMKDWQASLRTWARNKSKANSTKSASKQNQFNSFEQRKYKPGELESLLLS